MKDFLFVYGSLKSGFANNHLLQDSCFVCLAKTYPLYRMYGCGKFPALVKEEHGISIEGELWNIPKNLFRKLDEFEGVNIGLYRREIIFLAQPKVLSHIYLFCRATKNLSDCGSNWMREQLPIHLGFAQTLAKGEAEWTSDH